MDRFKDDEDLASSLTIAATDLAGDLTAKNNTKLVPLLGRTVTITGAVSERAGVTMIEADEAKIVNPPR